MKVYKIRRHFKDLNRRNIVLRTGLTLAQAQAHCNDPETCSVTALRKNSYTKKVGDWFDGYEVVA